MVRITFVLPRIGRHPVGGYSIAHEYANWLTRSGHKVTVVHGDTTVERAGPYSVFRSHVRSIVWQAVRMMGLTKRLFNWIRLDSNVPLKITPDISQRQIPDGDAVIATSWQTAEKVVTYPSSKGNKFYLVYDYEFFATADEPTRARMCATYHSSFDIIATSDVVTTMVRACGGEPRRQIPCGLDHHILGVRKPITDRARWTIGFPVRRSPLKGTAYAVEACRLLAARSPDRLRIKAFGPDRRPKELPEHVDYWRYTSDEELARWYNSVSIFVFPSVYEGWGLPGIEAMACGAALVTTDSGGVLDYAINGETAVVVPARRPDLLAEGAETLLRDDGLRQQLARNGVQVAQRYQWSHAAAELESVIARAQESATPPTDS